MIGNHPSLPSVISATDYVFGERKFGGNAQTITKNRWLHHTSFLWDFEDRNMELLRHPPKAPQYREVLRPLPAHVSLGLLSD